MLIPNRVSSHIPIMPMNNDKKGKKEKEKKKKKA